MCDRSFKNFARNQHVGSVVFCDQQPKMGLRGDDGRLWLGRFGGFCAGQVQGDMENRPLPQNRGECDVATHLLGQ